MDTAAWRRIERAVGNLILFAAFVLLLAGLSGVLARTGVRAELVKDGNGVQTVAQVVPATVVAIFVFALGAVFVIAQIVVPSRGSRTITVLLQDWRLRIVLVFGLALLAGALLLSGRSGDGNGAWRGDLAAGLVAATVIYVPCTTILFALSLKNFATPGPYKDLLLRRPLLLGLVPRRHPSPYDFYWRLRVLRGWMRTVSNTAESRDLLFALQGVVELVDQYCCAAARDRVPPIHDDPPDEYRQAQKSPIGRADRDRRGETDADGKGWFAYELGRALARAIETGARGNTLRRDLDRLLDAFVVSIEKMAMKHPRGGQQRLIEDAGIVVSHLTEVGLGVRQSDPAQHDWYRAPALRLAELHSYLDEVARCRREQEVRAAQNQALAGWLAVTAALRSDDPPAREAWKAFIKQCVSKLGAHKDWDRATELACEESFRPHWDIPTQADTTAIQELAAEARKP